MISPQAYKAMAGTELPGPGPKLTPQQRTQWNGFIDYLEKKGMKGNSQLDDRNKNLGQQLLNEYKKTNQGFSLGYDQVQQVQQDLQDYRSDALKSVKSGGATVDGGGGDDAFMPGLSQVDGWLGSKTSNWRFPGARLTNTDGTVQNYGTNTEAYDQKMKKIKKMNTMP